jgi:predicted nucleic acid-binding protein
MSTRLSTKGLLLVHERGLVDTSVLIELESVGTAALPKELAVSAVSFAELAAGPHATGDRRERARRQDRLQRIQATFDPLPFDSDAARAYGRVYAAVRSSGRKARGRRFADLLIAATALAARLPLYTRNPDDFGGLRELIEVVHVETAAAS